MTSPYLCHGQQSLCYLITEKGSQETDEHPEITQFYNPLSKVRHCGFSLSVCSLFERKWDTPRSYLLAFEALRFMTTPLGLSCPLKPKCPHFPLLMGQFFSCILCCYLKINILL